MREIKIKLYDIYELSDSARERAFQEWARIPDECTLNSEYRATLTAFEKAFDVKVYRWYVDENNYNFSIAYNRDADAFPDHLRFARWVWNNYAHHLQRGKYYGKTVYRAGQRPRHVYRYSNATVEYTCNLTGFVGDLAITDPVWKCIHYKEAFFSYDQLIESCLESFFAEWSQQMEYETTFEYFEEMCAANDWEFTEYGEKWEG
jgi:hypothetical protein